MDKEERNSMRVDEIPFQWNTVRSSKIYEEDKRLDASFYSYDIVKARILIEELKRVGIGVKRLGDDFLSAKIFWPGRFKRKYVSRKEGKPFLMPSEVFMFLPRARKFITDFPKEVLIEKEWILITRSGTIGRCIISNELLSKFVVSDDLIRIIPGDKNLVGYVYAYLNTWVGQTFLKKTKYGVTVKHIEPQHVESIPIPIIPQIEKEVNEKILKAHKLLEEAQELLLKAVGTIYTELGLPQIDEGEIEYFGGKRGKSAKVFITKFSELSLRLDASFHKPILSLLRKILREKENDGKYKLQELGSISEIFTPPRFKRFYVKDHSKGVPLLQGAHIPMIKPLDIKYLWKDMKNINAYVLNKNWILVTCSGTLGRVGLVRDYWTGWAATNHITRIISKDINPGYLTAYLQSAYGQYQLESLSYGGVVEEIGEAGELIKNILVPVPTNNELEEKIGNLVMQAYDKKDQANRIEEEAIRLLEDNFKQK
jgi:type I restriction enzyme S subunit